MKFFLRKLVRLLIVLFVVTFITFVSVRWLPGDPIAIKTGGGATQAQVAELRSYYGFDKPVFTQYWVWLGRAVTGDLGESVINPIKITTTLKHTLPISLTLMVWAQFLALLIAIPLGILTAYRAGTPSDRAINTASFGLLSIPEYVYAPLFVILIAVYVCTLAIQGATVRLMFSMGRDRRLPFGGTWGHVSPRFRTPANASVAVGVLAAIPFIVTGAGAAIYIAIAATGMIYLAYFLCNIRRGRLR